MGLFVMFMFGARWQWMARRFVASMRGLHNFFSLSEQKLRIFLQMFFLCVLSNCSSCNSYFNLFFVPFGPLLAIASHQVIC